MNTSFIHTDFILETSIILDDKYEEEMRTGFNTDFGTKRLFVETETPEE